MDSEIYFEVKSINGIIIRTTFEYWQKIVTFKHPAMAGLENEVKATVVRPDEIRQSIQNENVLLYYRKYYEYQLCVIVRVLGRDGFIITTYMTDKVKEGKCIWKK